VRGFACSLATSIIETLPGGSCPPSARALGSASLVSRVGNEPGTRAGEVTRERGSFARATDAAGVGRATGVLVRCNLGVVSSGECKTAVRGFACSLATSIIETLPGGSCPPSARALGSASLETIPGGSHPAVRSSLGSAKLVSRVGAERGPTPGRSRARWIRSRAIGAGRARTERGASGRAPATRATRGQASARAGKCSHANAPTWPRASDRRPGCRRQRRSCRCSRCESQRECRRRLARVSGSCRRTASPC
jgi:hypothetical protein